MKRLIVLFALAISSLALTAADNQRVVTYEPGNRARAAFSGKRMNTFKTIPHMAINSQWKSTLNLRNDNNSVIGLEVQFFKMNGDRATAEFETSDGQRVNGEGFSFDLFGYELFSLEFISVEGANSIHIYIFEENDNTNYSTETIYSNYSNQTKLSAVGVGNPIASNNFIMNIDHRADLFSGGDLFRGLAVTNTAESNCDCDVFFYDKGFGGTNQTVGPYDLGTLRLAGSEKWLWVSTDGFAGQSLDTLMGDEGLGHIFMECSQPVAVLGLGFEAGSTVVSSVPIDFYTASKAKRTIVR